MKSFKTITAVFIVSIIIGIEFLSAQETKTENNIPKIDAVTIGDDEKVVYEKQLSDAKITESVSHLTTTTGMACTAYNLTVIAGDEDYSNAITVVFISNDENTAKEMCEKLFCTFSRLKSKGYTTDSTIDCLEKIIDEEDSGFRSVIDKTYPTQRYKAYITTKVVDNTEEAN